MALTSKGRGLLIAALLCAGCLPSPVPDLNETPQTLDVAPGPYIHVLWVDDATVVLTLFPDVGEPVEVARLDLTTNSLRDLPLSGLEGCGDADVVPDGLVADGRLSIIRTCPPIGDTPSEFYAYDLASDDDELLATSDRGIRTASWNAALDRAIAHVGGVICGSLLWLTADGTEDVNVAVPGDEESFLLSDAAEMPTDCGDTGRAFGPEFSPDSTSIAFLASPDSIGIDGPARLEAPHALYTFEPTDSVATRILAGLDQTTAPRWSPDGTWIALSGNLGQVGTGTFAIDSRTHGLVRITSAVFEDLAWSRDGQSIIGIISSSPAGEISTELLATVDVSELHTVDESGW